MAKTVDASNVLLLCKALAYAIITIERLPEHRQAFSDKEAMRDLLTDLYPEDAQRMLDEAHRQITGEGWGPKPH